MVLAAESSGAAMVELGIPFSDPLADGPVIQASSQVSIENGVTISWILDTVFEIRKQSEIPIALMGYINPFIKYGLSQFLSDSKYAGIDGIIIPDLPLEEADDFVKMSKENDISPILLVAPNTPDIRIRKISVLSGDLIYCVAILGITGNQGKIDDELKYYLSRVDKNSVCPYIVGFGISERSDVINVNKMAHGAVVGSAIIREIGKSRDPVECVNNYIERLISEK
jgi:tryptophan synthase alpha chain